MDAAIAGLVGAGIGALASMVGTLIAHILQSRRESNEWVLEKREAAYSNSLRYLLKVLNRRSKVTSTGEAVLGLDAVADWLGDLSEAQIWVSSLTIYCSKNLRERIQQISASLNAQIAIFAGSRVATQAEHGGIVKAGRSAPEEMPNDLIETVAHAYQVILEGARNDLGRNL
jgi:hypothetical protein